MKIKFNVSGMTCSACQAHIEKAVKKLDGVSAVNVNLLRNFMQVEFDEKAVDTAKIIAAVENAGYGAFAFGAESEERIKAEDGTNELKAMKNRLIFSVCFLIPLFYICMGHMLGLPIPSILDGHENMMIFALTQLLLTVPIIVLNFHFFTAVSEILFIAHRIWIV